MEDPRNLKGDPEENTKNPKRICCHFLDLQAQKLRHLKNWTTT